jgi:hypothetical protein
VPSQSARNESTWRHIGRQADSGCSASKTWNRDCKLRVQPTTPMVETISETSEIAIEKSAPARRLDRMTRSSDFKYYIHDGVDTCRFQLIGELTEPDVAELTGCWRTAKTTLGKRKLVLDLRRLKSVDEAGTKWVIAMAAERPEYLPGEIFKNGVFIPPTSNTSPAEHTGRTRRFGILSTIFRILRPSSAESSTQAQ